MIRDKFNTRTLTVTAILTALSLLAFMVENLFPPVFIPGAKIGLANVFSTVALIAFSPVEAFAVVACRTILGAILQGNVSALLYSFSGGIISIAVSSLAVYTIYPKISIMAISVCSAICHNAIQTIIYYAVTQSIAVFTYLPYLLIIAVPSGLTIGGAVILITKILPSSLIQNVKKTAKRDNKNSGVQF